MTEKQFRLILIGALGYFVGKVGVIWLAYLAGYV